MIEDEPIFGDEAVKQAAYWIDEFGAGAITATELRRLLSQVLPGSLPRLMVGALWWDQVVSWYEACRLTGFSHQLYRRQLFGTRQAQATECRCWFEATTPRELAEPPDWCPSHRPLSMPYPLYLRQQHWLLFSRSYKQRHPVCEFCLKQKAVDVHHTPEGYQNLWRETDDDVWALCRRCHETAHVRAVEQ